VKSNPIFIFNY